MSLNLMMLLSIQMMEELSIKKDYKSMIAAINSLAKLGGLDNHTQKIEIENNNETPQEITININKSKK